MTLISVSWDIIVLCLWKNYNKVCWTRHPNCETLKVFVEGSRSASLSDLLGQVVAPETETIHQTENSVCRAARHIKLIPAEAGQCTHLSNNPLGS